jgi:replicative DNA helicase
MDQDRVRELVRAREEQVVRSTVARAEERYTYVRPFLAAAVDLIDYLTDEAPRFEWGLPELDDPLQGIARGELCYLTGKAHSGKTQLVLNALCNAPETRMLWFTPDETEAKILAQLVALIYDIDAFRLGERMKAKDPDAFNLAYHVTTNVIPNLIIVPQALTFPEMTDALHQAEDYWGNGCETVMVDYLDLLPGGTDYTGTKTKSVNMKAWAKRNRQPVICVHQPRRGGAERGERIGMDDLHMGGDTEATFVLGVYRRRDRYRASLEDKYTHQDTVTVNISKNKHPPCTTGEFDFHLHPTSGRIRPLRAADLVQPGQPIDSARVALEASRNHMPVNTDQVIDLAARRLEHA